jgi:hypothetical protein
VRTNSEGRDSDGGDWQDVRRRRGKAHRQEYSDMDVQQEDRKHGGRIGYGNKLSRVTVSTGWHGNNMSGLSGGAAMHINRQPPRKEHVQRRSEADVGLNWQRDGAGDKHDVARGADGRMDKSDVSQLKWFVTFYFTNFPPQLSNFYLRKGFEVCGILEEVVVPSRRNVNGEIYGFVRFSKVRDVGKLLKAVNAVYFGNFRVRATITRFDRSVLVKGRSGKEEEDLVYTSIRGDVEGNKQAVT